MQCWLLLWWWCAHLVSGALAKGEVYLETFQSGVWKVPEDTLHNLTLSLGFNNSEVICDHGSDLTEAQLVVTVVPDEEWKLDFVDVNVNFTAEEVCEGVNKSLTFSGYYWGVTRLTFLLTHNDLDPYFTNSTLLRDDLMITVDRKSLTLDRLMVSCGSVLVLCNNINMGAQLDLQIIMSVLRRPVGPVCGFISQFVVMPTATYVMGSLLFTDSLQRLGLFTLGCSPGGASSNFWTLMFDGDINLSITMTAISTVAAMGMMPLWLSALGGKMLQDAEIKIPFMNLVISLISLTVPISIGIFIRLKKPMWAEKGAKIIKPFSLCTLLFFFTVGSINSYKIMLTMTWQMVVAGVMVMSCGYAIGAAFAKLVCLSKKQIIAVSIETALQNAGVAFLVVKLSLETPYSDMASVTIIATLLMSGPPLILAFLIYTLLRRCCGCCPDAHLPQALPSAQENTNEMKHSPGDTEGEAGEVSTFLPDPRK